MNIIGDVQGMFDPLMRLVKQMPADEFLFVGDLNDRGPDSRKVIEWVMSNAKCLQSNHGDMLVDLYDGCRLYGPKDFISNGGIATLKSYDVPLSNSLDELIDGVRKQVPKEHIEWLRGLPFYYEAEDLFVSHAARCPGWSFRDVCVRGPAKRSLLWNRYDPERTDKFQVFGHDGYFYQLDDYAMCIDDTKEGRLMGLHWPSREVFSEPFGV